MTTERRAGVRRFDHIGLVVEDLPLVTAFFEDLGFEHGGPMDITDRWVSRMVGLEGVKMEMTSVSAPDGSGRIELTKFHHPADPASPQEEPANRLGYRHVAYVVDDVDAVLDRLRSRGLRLVGEVVDFENVFRMGYVEGPEGIIVELAQEL